MGLAIRGLSGQVLSYSNPTGGYKIQNQLRAKTGLEITPINQSSIKKAINYMRHGGFVFTGVDRPVENKDKTLNFFGTPSPLPTGHIRMAIKANVPIIVASASMDQNGYYHIEFSNPIKMKSFNNSEDDIRMNAEIILEIFEERIKKHPNQWLMYYPVWPSLTEI
jgi:KDO2-lipid IV(A) lauroyltransferase